MLVWIGLRSYGLYLYHWPVYQLMRHIAGKHMKFHEFLIAMGITLVITELSYRYIETPIRKGALGKSWAKVRDARDPGRRNAVLAGAFVGTALAIFGVTSLATAELKQNEVQESLTAGRGVDLRRDRRPDVRGGDDGGSAHGRSGGRVDTGNDDRSARRMRPRRPSPRPRRSRRRRSRPLRSRSSRSVTR